ncbi:MAG: ribbon-helix-helix protein, CopG family [Oceanipulchritudo sp.]
MRTTVTIDPDTEHLLREEAARTGASFKEVLNGAIRQALAKPPSD